MTLANFDELLAKYAHLLIKKGLNVGTGDYVHINTDVNQIQLTHLLVKQAYETGAAHVSRIVSRRIRSRARSPRWDVPV